MRGVHIVGTWCFIVNIYFISPNKALKLLRDGAFLDALVDPTTPANVPNEEENSAPSDDPYTYVAMIDMQFVDQTKRICSAAIIHDHVVITAAHCFIKSGSNPELSLSFIVIGTQKMYETGYEHYLPIERYKYHPKFRGWSADLALVYSYTAMTGEKPGKIIALAGEKLKNPIDTSITVMSWGNMTITKRKKKIKIPIQAEPEEEPEPTVLSEDGQVVTAIKEYKGWRARKSEIQTLPSPKPKPLLGGNINSWYLSSPPKSTTSTETDGVTVDFRANNDPANTTTGRMREEYAIKVYPADGRRSLSHIKSKLTMEVFGFVNQLRCMQVIEGVKTFVYILSDNDDFICFSSDKHFITNEDLGAPLIRQGRLFGVTVGGVESDDGEHVAMGMRIACFCNWIAENLPWGGDEMECCQDCCYALLTSPRPVPKQVMAFEGRRV